VLLILVVLLFYGVVFKLVVMIDKYAFMNGANEVDMRPRTGTYRHNMESLIIEGIPIVHADSEGVAETEEVLDVFGTKGEGDEAAEDLKVAKYLRANVI
jgi:hypothetical protein